MAILLDIDVPPMVRDDTDSPGDTEATPADAFALVGHEIRVEIIRALGDPDGDTDLAFGEIRSKLSTDVEPSQLHYHLEQLLGHFVAKTDGTYTLRPVGLNLCLSLHAGTFDRRQEEVSVDANFECYDCQTPVEATLKDGFIHIRCPACGIVYDGYFFEVPLESFEDAPTAVSHFSQSMVFHTLSRAFGVCPSCTHPLDWEMLPVENDPLRTFRIQQECNLCTAIWPLSIGQLLLADPGLIAFCNEHDVNVLSTPWWELEFAATDEHVTVRSTDPLEVALAVTFDDETLELVVDDDLTVIERNRSPVHGGDDSSLVDNIQRTDGRVGSIDGTDQVVFPEERTCLGVIRWHRWPDGVVCPHCESADTIKKGKTTKGTQRYRCQNCKTTFNDLSGTVFADRSLSLPEMFYVIRRMDEAQTERIASQLDRSYRSILDFVHHVRDAREAAADIEQ